MIFILQHIMKPRRKDQTCIKELNKRFFESGTETKMFSLMQQQATLVQFQTSILLPSLFIIIQLFNQDFWMLIMAEEKQFLNFQVILIKFVLLKATINGWNKITIYEYTF